MAVQDVTVPAYELVKRRLRAKLTDAGGWQPGTRLPPIKQLAQQLGAGQTNTHRAVKELAAEGYFVARPRRGTFVQAPGGDQAGRVINRSVLRGRTIAVIHQGGRIDPFLSVAVDSLTQTLNRAGAISRVDAVTSLALAPVFEQHVDADAIVVVNPHSHPPLRVRDGQFLVAIETGVDTNVAMAGGYDIITTDSRHGGYEAGVWMRRTGAAEVCFMGVPVLYHGEHRLNTSEQFVRPVNYEPISAQRLAGFELGWGAAVPESLRLMARQYTGQAGARAFAQYLALKNRPAGVFCASDDLAVGFIYAAFSHGLEPGRNYQIIGFDGQIRGRRIEGGPLTTIDLPCERMGRLAVELLEERFIEPGQPVRRVSLGGSLFPGCTAVPAFSEPPAKEETP